MAPVKRGLSTRIEETLQADDRLSEQPIMATVRKSVVRLKGMVKNHRCKLLAESIAASFEECSEVINELVVETKGRVPDEELAESVRAVLDSHPDVSSEVIGISVENGVVTLRGNIVGAWERGLVENAARRVDGVTGLRNEVVVDLAKSMEDESLCCAILAVLAEEPNLSSGTVRVAVTNGTALLSGIVPSVWQRKLAETAARRAGASEIQTDIIVADE
jgi:osmotically-inducible protein OsmY